MKAIVVHRRAATRSVAAQALAAAGWTVSEAGSAADAWPLVRRQVPHVLVAEAGLLSAGEPPLLDHIRATDALDGVRVIGMVSELELHAAMAAHGGRLDELVVEPVRPAELVVRATTAYRLGQLAGQVRNQEEDLRSLVHTDPLTGLANRQLAAQRLKAQVSAARRHARLLSLLFLDVDGFKGVNDTLGHAAGDEVLRDVAAALAERLRSEDLAARWAGDEFIVVLPDTDAEAAARVAADLRDRSRRWLDDGRMLSISVGVAEWAGETPDELLHRADAALYAAKRGGRDRLHVAAPPATRAAPSPREERLLRVLIADDMPGVRAVLTAYLEGTGVEVVGEAGSGERAVELAGRLRPDVVVMDLIMPDVDGIEATRRLTELLPGIDVVGFSSEEDPVAEARMREAGATAYFVKSDVAALVDWLAARTPAGAPVRG